MVGEDMTAAVLAAWEAFGDPDRRDAHFDLYADDVLLHGYTPRPLASREAVRAFYAELFLAFPDARTPVDQALPSGDHLTLRYRLAGTHLGDFMGEPASGRAFEVPAITVMRFAGGRVVERWSLTDLLALTVQIGVIAVPGS